MISILIFEMNSERKMLPNPIVIPYRIPIPKYPISGSTISSWSLKLIFGGFEEYMSTLQIPNMKIKLPIEMDLYGFYYFRL